MRSLVFPFALVLAVCGLAVVGCAESRTPTSDAEITYDAYGLVDGGRPVDAYVPVCGDGRVDPGESCDDGNTTAGDGCSPTCRRERYCGDGTRDIDLGEECDDGNHVSGDGCRSDCLSDESCGNGIVDYAAGELCDDAGAGACSADCRMRMGCPDGTVDAGEACDDGNTDPWDACSNGCEETVSFVLDMPSFAPRTVGCDYSGDGLPDNRLAASAGDLLNLLNMYLGGGGPTFMMSFLGLDDPAAINDPSLRAAWLQGQAGPMAGTYYISRATLNADGTPITSVESSIVDTFLDGGPEDLDFNIPFLPLTLQEGRIRGTTVATAGRVSGINEGLVCGVVSIEPFTSITETLIESFGSMGGFTIDIPPPCDGSTADSTMADWIAGGANIAIIRLRAQQPDVDLDGDGLEVFEITGGTDCQPVITACIDGDGTRVEGRDCIFDPRFTDGYSAALEYTATRVTTVGTAP